MRLKNTFALFPAIRLPATSKGVNQVTLSNSHTFLLTSSSSCPPTHTHTPQEKAKDCRSKFVSVPPPPHADRNPLLTVLAARMSQTGDDTWHRCLPVRDASPNPQSLQRRIPGMRRASLAQSRGPPRPSSLDGDLGDPAGTCSPRAASPGSGMEDTSQPCTPSPPATCPVPRPTRGPPGPPPRRSPSPQPDPPARARPSPDLGG